MVLAEKQKNADGIEFNGYKFTIGGDLQALILAEKDLAREATKNGGKAFLEKTFNERFGMTIDKALAELPADIREKLKQVDARTLLSAVMVGGVAVAALKKLPSEAVAVLAAGLTLKEVIQYGAAANHIADKIGKSTKASDLPVAELKSLITNGGLDILLASVGYAGVKLAPKFAKLGDDALKLTDDAAREYAVVYLFEAYTQTGKWQQAEKLMLEQQPIFLQNLGYWLQSLAISAGRQNAAADALRIWLKAVNFSGHSVFGLTNLADTPAKPQIRAYYQQMKERQPNSAIPDVALKILR
jgi:hypothetical protein